MKSIVSYLSCVYLGLIVACSSPEPIQVEKQQLQAVAVGPLFSGVNTATAEFKIGDLLPEGISPNQIANAKITALSVTVSSEGAPSVNSYTALLSSPKEAMNQFAFTNEVKEGTTQLSVAEDQDFLGAILRDDAQTIVIDFDLAEDYFDNLEIDTEIEWEISVTK